VAFYALNIIDANVDAALLQFNVDENLSVRPVIYPNDVTFKTNVGLTFNYNFRFYRILLIMSNFLIHK
jgi:hypothetical protein